ncbi:hypothetical protein AC578_10283 [Pseudocercospora eumusae]|uniref:Zn(2)-C6 fungal-type domain-containing protein n=1 Tax=Pseudocercospora eumusae TaxID=321146 RepID=A0A139HRD2_9PEZI|nr:hypothetical protein AC578_10283 [Pseudocercospora eumusae]
MPSPACDQCFRRKHPCLGGRPSCEQCLKTGLTCTYSTGKPVGKPKGHKKRRMGGSTSSAQLSAALVSCRESFVSATSGAEGELHTLKKRKLSRSPEIPAPGPTSNATMHPSITSMALTTLSPQYMTSAEYPWHASSSGSVPTTGEEPIYCASSGSFEQCLQQPMLTSYAWMPHADLLEWQALLNQSPITNTTNMAPTTILDGTQLFANPPRFLDPHSHFEYGVLPFLSPTATTPSQASNTSMTIYRSCEFKDTHGTNDQHLAAIRETINCVQSALHVHWPSCTGKNCLDVCLMDCILALQQCIECLCAVISAQHRHEQPQTHLLHTYSLAKEIDRLTTKARLVMELRGATEDDAAAYLLPLLGSLETSMLALNERLLGFGDLCVA